MSRGRVPSVSPASTPPVEYSATPEPAPPELLNVGVNSDISHLSVREHPKERAPFDGSTRRFSSLEEITSATPAVFPRRHSARAEGLDFAQPHDEGAVGGAGLRGLEDAQSLRLERLELEGRAVEVVARFERRDRAPLAAAVPRLKLHAARGHVTLLVEAPVDVDGRDARRAPEVQLPPVRLGALGRDPVAAVVTHPSYLAHVRYAVRERPAVVAVERRVNLDARLQRLRSVCWV